MADKKISALTAATTPLAGTEVLPIVQSGSTVKVSVDNLTAGRAVSAGVTTITGPDQATASVSTASNVDAVLLSTGTSVDSGGSLIFGAASGAWKFAAIKALATNGGGNSAGSLSVSTRRNTADSTLTESLRWHASGGISINSATDPSVGNLLLGTGNLIQGTAAKGVNFTANTSAAGMTSQLLNWYEEGTFTPVVSGSTSAGTASYGRQAGRYTRVGRLVTFQIDLDWSSGTGTGNLEFTGLPFTSASVINVGVGISYANITLTANNIPQPFISPSTTKIVQYQVPVGGGSVTAVTYVATGAAMLFGSYIV